MFNGKPIEHWEEQADCLMLDILVDRIYYYHSSNSITHQILFKRLYYLSFGIYGKRLHDAIKVRGTEKYESVIRSLTNLEI